MEGPGQSSSEQMSLDYRSDAELTESIFKKRKNGIPLDEKEAKFAAEQAKEDKEERDTSYPH